MTDETVSGWWYVLGGFAIGIAAGFFFGDPSRPGLASRLIKRLPARVKVGGAVGAVKGAGRAAVRR